MMNTADKSLCPAMPGSRALFLEDLDAYERHLGRLRGRETGAAVAPEARAS